MTPKHYAYGHFGLDDDRKFDSSCGINYIDDQHKMLAALSVVADDFCNTQVARLNGVVAPETLQDHANKWASLKATLRANLDMPFQQIATPDGRVFWWCKLV